MRLLVVGHSSSRSPFPIPLLSRDFEIVYHLRCEISISSYPITIDLFPVYCVLSRPDCRIIAQEALNVGRYDLSAYAILGHEPVP